MSRQSEIRAALIELLARWDALDAHLRANGARSMRFPDARDRAAAARARNALKSGLDNVPESPNDSER